MMMERCHGDRAARRYFTGGPLDHDAAVELCHDEQANFLALNLISMPQSV
jgi:hypothetical protein